MWATAQGQLPIGSMNAAGGVAPIPLYLEKTSAYLKGRSISENLVDEITNVIKLEITPISDARGTADYKRGLLGQLIKAHFLRLFPELDIEKVLVQQN